MFPLAMGLVVTLSPSEKDLDPEISPVTDPSAFFFHRDMVGTPRGAVFFGIGLDGRGAAGFGRPSSGAPPPSPNSEKVARGLADLTASRAAFASCSFRSLVSVIVAPDLADPISLTAAATFAFLVAGSALKK